MQRIAVLSLLFLVTLSACDSAPATSETFLIDTHASDIKHAREALEKNDSLGILQWLDSVEQIDVPPLWLQWFVLSARNDLAYSRRDYATAMHYANQMGDFLAQFEVDPASEADVFFRQGDNYFRLRQYDLAMQAFLKGKTLGDEATNKCILAGFNYRLGMVSYKQGNMQEAVDFWRLSLRNYDNCSDLQTTGLFRIQEIASNIGLAYWQLKDYDQSIHWYDSALLAVQTLPTKTAADSFRIELARAVIAGNRAFSHYERGEKDTALVLLETSFDFNFNHKNGDQGHAIFIGNQLVRYLLMEEKLDKAQTLLHKLSGIISSLPNSPSEQAFIGNQLNYYIKSRQTDSIDYFFKRYALVADSLQCYGRDLNKLNTSLLLSGLEKDHALKTAEQEAKAQQNIRRVGTIFLVILTITICVVIYLLLRARRQNQTLRMLNDFVNKQNQQLEQAKLEQKKMNEELAASNARKDELMRIVAHDLRNPLAAIYSMSQVVLDQVQGEDREFFELTQKACEGALQLINDLLEGKAPSLTADAKTVFSTQPINAFLQETLKLVAHRAAEKDITLHFDPVKPSLLVRIDTERLRRALINLLVNAIKFSPRGGAVALQAGLKDDALHIAVIDNGIGISEADQAGIFNAHPTTNNTGTEGEQSFGMGLSITKRIADQHGAKLQVSSVQGQGAVFTLSLPAGLIEGVMDQG